MKRQLRQRLQRQAAWQRARKAKPWAEKLRLSIIMRETLLAMRKRRPPRSP